MIEPKLEILSSSQRSVWSALAEVPKHFVLYGGMALALRLGHRPSADFNFLTSRAIAPEEMLQNMPLLHDAKIVRNTAKTLTVAVNSKDPIKISFSVGLTFGRVGEYDQTSDNGLTLASLLDLAGTKAALITQRAEAKDYVDLLAIINSGISLSEAMAAARAIYGELYNPMLTVKSLTFFMDGDLPTLPSEVKEQCQEISANQKLAPHLPDIQRI